jgi:carbon starvation protein
MWTLASSNAFNALWPIFGTANQLLAALSLLAVSAWLLLRKKKAAVTLVPAVFMFLTTLASLSILLTNYIRKRNYVLIAADLTLFLLSIGVIGLFIKMFLRKKTEAAEA